MWVNYLVVACRLNLLLTVILAICLKALTFAKGIIELYVDVLFFYGIVLCYVLGLICLR